MMTCNHNPSPADVALARIASALQLVILLSLALAQTVAAQESCQVVTWGGETVTLTAGQILRNDDGNGSQWWGQGACSAESFTIPSGGSYEITCSGSYTMDYFNGRLCDTVIDSGDELTVPWYGGGCSRAQVSTCSTSDNSVRLYANGLHLGDCLSVPVEFNSRMVHTDTITLLAGSSFDLYALELSCLDLAAAGEDPQPITPTLTSAETITPSLDAQAVLGGGGFLGISFGGDLSDPNAPINQWVGIGQQFVSVVNSGGILYIIGAVAGAGAVLGWAIGTVKNPERF